LDTIVRHGRGLLVRGRQTAPQKLRRGDVNYCRLPLINLTKAMTAVAMVPTKNKTSR